MMEQTEVTNQVSPEMKSKAVQRARQRSLTARWDTDVAVFFFTILIIIIILLFQGIGVEVVAPVAAFGLALGWLMGWRKANKVYEIFYDEELSILVKESKKTIEETIEETIEDSVQKALRKRLRE